MLDELVLDGVKLEKILEPKLVELCVLHVFLPSQLLLLVQVSIDLQYVLTDLCIVLDNFHIGQNALDLFDIQQTAAILVCP